MKQLRNMTLFNYLAMISLIVALPGCENDNGNKKPGGARIIRFSGYDWIVYTTGDMKGGPGPNYFSDSEENVWIDGKEVPTDFVKLFKILKEKGYRGYLPLETLGAGDPYQKVPVLLENVRKALTQI